MNWIELKPSDIENEILNSSLFEFYFKYDLSSKIHECVNHIAFGDNKKLLYISLVKFDDEFDITKEITNEIIIKDVGINLAERNGNIIAKFEFDGCKLIDIAPVRLDYSGNYKTPKHYIVTIEYEHFYQINAV